MLWAFLPIAILVTITPGAATAMVIRSALRGGLRAVVLVYLGVQSLRRAGAGEEVPAPHVQRAFRDGLITSLANPKLAVFFVALFPQFVGPDSALLATTLLMALMIVALDRAAGWSA